MQIDGPALMSEHAFMIFPKAIYNVIGHILKLDC